MNNARKSINKQNVLCRFGKKTKFQKNAAPIKMKTKFITFLKIISKFRPTRNYPRNLRNRYAQNETIQNQRFKNIPALQFF